MSATQPSSSEAALARVISRVTRRIIPMVLLMYILAFLDRANVGFAKASLQADVGLSEAAYALGAGIFFLGYAVLEVPSNIVMNKVGAKIWLSRIMVSWGLVSAAMLFTANEWSFYLLRVLLGITEAGFFPGVILYLTYWIPASHRGRVNGLFYFGAPLAFIIGGPLSGVLLDLDGLFGLRGWQLMFLVTGIITVVVGVVAYFYLDDKPQDAKWLSADEKRVLDAAMSTDEKIRSNHSPRGALRALANGRVLYLAAIYFCIQIAVYGVTFFLPTQIAAITGQKVGLAVGLLTAVPWTIAIIGVVIATRISDRTGIRAGVAATCLGLAAVGIVLGAITTNPVMALGGLSLGAAGFIAVQPVFWTLPAGILTGMAAASGIALINSIGSLGGFLAPNLKTWADSAFGGNGGQFALAAVALTGAVLIAAAGRLRIRTHDDPDVIVRAAATAGTQTPRATP